MTMISVAANARCDALVEDLRAEFGAILADRILEAEAADYLWEARVRERYLGQHLDVGFGDFGGERELSRIAILSFLGGLWHTASCLVDGEGRNGGSDEPKQRMQQTPHRHASLPPDLSHPARNSNAYANKRQA